MRVLRRALLLLGVLAGLFAMHGLAPAAGTDVLAAGPHPHPAVQLAAGPAHDPAAAPSDLSVIGQLMPGGAMPIAMQVEAMPGSSSGSPAPGHGGHGSHLDGLCLAVLAGAAMFMLALALLGRRHLSAAAPAVGHRLRHARAVTLPPWPPDLARLCVLRI